VTEVSTLYGHLSCSSLSVVCVWSTHATVGSGHGWLGVVIARNFPSASLAGRGRCTATRPEWQAGHNGLVRIDCGVF